MSRLNTQIFENRISGDFSESTAPKSEWLTSNEAAEYLRINVGTLRNMVCNGTLKPSGKIGRLNRFRLEDLRNLLLKK